MYYRDVVNLPFTTSVLYQSFFGEEQKFDCRSAMWCTSYMGIYIRVLNVWVKVHTELPYSEEDDTLAYENNALENNYTIKLPLTDSWAILKDNI